MSSLTEEPFSIPEAAPIFPLPDAVLFPRQVLALHIFEPRYQSMTANALAGNKCIAVALLRPGFEPQYFTKHAPIHGVVGVGRIVAHEELEDGKYNILLRGEGRAAILEELTGRPYRVARLEAMQSFCTAPRDEVSALRCNLREAIAACSWAPAELRERYAELFDTPLALGDLTDVICGCLPVASELRQRLLAESNAFARAAELIEHLRTLGAIARNRPACSRERQFNLN